MPAVVARHGLFSVRTVSGGWHEENAIDGLLLETDDRRPADAGQHLNREDFIAAGLEGHELDCHPAAQVDNPDAALQRLAAGLDRQAASIGRPPNSFFSRILERPTKA